MQARNDMATPAEIRARLEEMAKEHGPAVSNIAKVKSVNENKATCVLEDEDEIGRASCRERV